MIVKRLDNGNLLVPVRAESEDGTIGDGVREIGPDHPDYSGWVRWIEAHPDQAQEHPEGDDEAPTG